MDRDQISQRFQSFLSEEHLSDDARQYISSFKIEYLEFLSHQIQQLISLPIFSELLDEILTILESLQEYDRSHAPLLTLSAPIFLYCLCLQPEPEPNDTYGLAETAAVGLQILAEKFGEDNERWEELSSLVLPFIQANITHESWRHRDAALMAFGTIVGFSDRNSQQILQLIQAMIPILLALLQQNQSPGLIRSSSLWAIGRLFSGQLSFMISSNLDPTPLLNGLTNALSDPNVKVQEQAVSAIGHFGEALSEDIRGISSQAILSLLIQRLSHFTNPQSNPHLDIKVKLASYNAMSCLLDHNPMEDEQQTLMVLEETLRRLEWALGNSPEDLEPLCGFLSTLVNSLSSETLQAHADAIIRILLRSIPYASSDGFIALGSVITGCPQAIRSHQVTIVASVIRRLDSNPCLDSIRFVGDICHALLEGVTPYAHTLIPRLMEILRNSDSRELKSSSISSIGDIFLTANGAEVAQYVSPFLDSLRDLQTSAEVFEFNENDPDSDDTLCLLIESFLTAYTSVAQALKDSPHLDLLSPHLGTMIHLIQQVSICSPSLLSESVGLLGDLWALFGTQVEDHISRQVLMRFLEQCEEHVDSSVLAYVMNAIQRSTEAADNEMNTDE